MTHGQLASYKRGCRCLPCRVANSDRVHRQRAGVATGPTRVDAAAAHAHLWALKAAGVGAWRAAELAGVSKTLVSQIRAGVVTRITAKTAAAILAVPPSPALGTLVSAAETWRRIRTLVAEGYTRRELARRLGYKSKLPFLKGEGAKVTVRVQLRVRRLYRQLEGGQDRGSHTTQGTDTDVHTMEESDGRRDDD